MKESIKVLAIGVSLSALTFAGALALAGEAQSCGDKPVDSKACCSCCASKPDASKTGCSCCADKLGAANACCASKPDASKACCSCCADKPTASKACCSCCADKPAGSKACCSCCADKPAASKEGVQILSTKEMEEIVAAKKATVLDARSGKYDDGRRIPGAKSLNAKSSKEEVEAVLKDKDAPVVTYCANLECPASGMLAKHLRELGFKNVKEYPLGIDAWAAAGKEIEKAGK